MIVEITLTPRTASARLKRKFAPGALEALIEQTTFLPPAIELIPRLLMLLEDPDVNCDALEDIIQVDAGLMADVLQVANSAAHGAARRTHCLREAIVRIGLKEIYREVIKVMASPALLSQDACSFQRVDLWRHSLAAAVAAEILARHLTEEEPEVVFTAALLHDVGKVALAGAIGADYFELLANCAERNQSIHRAEKEVFQMDHTQVADRLLRRWKFPEAIVAAIAGHHAPLQVPKDGRLAALLYAGNILAYRIGQGNGFPPYSIYPEAGALKLIDLEPDQLKGYEDEVHEIFRREQDRLW